MTPTIIFQKDYIVHTWAGGTTAEIFCYPPESSWNRKDFEIRISTADCRLDGAPYSDFSGYTRHITPLKGRMHMVHRNHHELKLEPFDVDIFDGAWETHHTGIAIDFNLLHTDRWQGQIKALTANDCFVIMPHSLAGFYAVVDATVTVGERSYNILQGDFLLFHPISYPQEIHFASHTDGPCVISVMATLKENRS